jgi:hypothetical protein
MRFIRLFKNTMGLKRTADFYLFKIYRSILHVLFTIKQWCTKAFDGYSC